MSPTVFKIKGFRFFFFSREEKRKHVHIQCSKGEAKFWLEPKIELAKNLGLSSKELREIEYILRERHEEIIKAWESFFGS